MSVYLAEVTGPGADTGERSMAASDDSQDDGPRNSGVKPASGERATPTAPALSQPPPSYRQADDHVQLALAESTHAEANLGLLVRGLQHLLAGAGAARDAHASLTRELGILRELLSQAQEAEQAALRRLQQTEQALAALRRDSVSERLRFIDEEDRFLADLIDDHGREVAELRAKLHDALAAQSSATRQDTTVERLGSAVTLPSLQAQSAASPPEFPVSSWTTRDATFSLSDWAPQPPFSLAEFAEEKKSEDFEKELLSARESGRPTPVEPTESSALINRSTGRVIDPEETPLPTWQAISKLESLRAPDLPPQDPSEAAEESLPIATSQKRATLPAMPPPPAPAAAPSPGDPEPRSGQVIAAIKPKSVKIPRHTPPPSILAEEADEPEPLTVRPKTPVPDAVAAERAIAEERAPHLVDTVRPPPLIKPKPDLSQRPLREYSLGKTDVAEERLDGPRSPDSER